MEDDARVKYGQAAWMLEDALGGRTVAKKYPKDVEARGAYFKVARFDKMYEKALLLMLFLTAFETPTWCKTMDGYWSFVASKDRCVISGVPSEDILLSNVPYIPPGYGLVLEGLVLLMVLPKVMSELMLQRNYFDNIENEHVPYFNTAMSKFGLFMILIEVADMVRFLTTPGCMRFAFISRTGFLFLLTDVRNLAYIIWVVFYPMMSIGTFLLVTIVFFSWIVRTIFGADDSVIEIMDNTRVSKGFETFGATIYSMFVAGCSEEFMGMFIGTYTQYRQSGLLWFVFLFFVQVLLLSLVLDTLVAAYTAAQEEDEEEFLGGCATGMRNAFESLTPNSALSKQVFLDFLKEMSRSPRTRPIAAQTASFMFDAVDTEKHGTINQNQFCMLCQLMQYELVAKKKDSPLRRLCPGAWNAPWYVWFRAQVDKDPDSPGFGFDGFMNSILGLNLILVVAETVYTAYGYSDLPWWMENLELIFSLVYVGEVALRLCVWHWQEYWSSVSNRFDFFTTWALLGSTVAEIVLAGDSSADVKRYMNILRLMRLLRVVKQLKRFKTLQKMIRIITKLVTAASPFLKLLAVVIFFFTTLSVELWGGLLYKSNPHLKGSEWDESKYHPFNFHDVLMATGTWVVALLCEYVPQFPEAVALATGGAYTWWIFPIFYVCGCSVVFELVKAFTIETFVELSKELEKQESVELSKELEKQERDESKGQAEGHGHGGHAEGHGQGGHEGGHGGHEGGHDCGGHGGHEGGHGGHEGHGGHHGGGEWDEMKLIMHMQKEYALMGLQLHANVKGDEMKKDKLKHTLIEQAEELEHESHAEFCH